MIEASTSSTPSSFAGAAGGTGGSTPGGGRFRLAASALYSAASRRSLSCESDGDGGKEEEHQPPQQSPQQSQHSQHSRWRPAPRQPQLPQGKKKASFQRSANQQQPHQQQSSSLRTVRTQSSPSLACAESFRRSCEADGDSFRHPSHGSTVPPPEEIGQADQHTTGVGRQHRGWRESLRSGLVRADDVVDEHDPDNPWDYDADERSTGATGSARDNSSGPFAPSLEDYNDERRRSSRSNADEDPPKRHKLWTRVSSSFCCCDWQTQYPRVTAFRNLCGRLVNDDKVQLVIVILIILNAIAMGLETFEFVEDNAEIVEAFNVTDRIFLILFTIESAFQFIYHGFGLFTDGWLFFDVLIVILSWSFESMQVIRAFRIFRCFRLVTRLAVLKNLVLSIFAVAPSMTAIVALLLLILYIYAVMCTTLFGDLYPEYTDEDYFGTLFLSLFTLFSMMTLEWADVVRQVMVKYYWSCFLFSTFVVSTGFILYSLVIAVVCDAVKVTEHKEAADQLLQEKERQEHRLSVLRRRIGNAAHRQGVAAAQIRMALRELDKLDNEDDEDDEYENENDEDNDGYGNDLVGNAAEEDAHKYDGRPDTARRRRASPQSPARPRSPRSTMSSSTTSSGCSPHSRSRRLRHSSSGPGQPHDPPPFPSSPQTASRPSSVMVESPPPPSPDRSERTRLSLLSLPSLSSSGRDGGCNNNNKNGAPAGGLADATSHAVVLELLEGDDDDDDDDDEDEVEEENSHENACAGDSDTAAEQFVDDESRTR